MNLTNKTLAFGVGLLWLCAWLSASGAEAPEKAVKLSDLPPAAQRTIGSQSGGAKLVEILQVLEGATTNYEVEVVTTNRTRSFVVDERGALLQTQVFMNELPPPLRKAIRTQVGKATLGDITKCFDDDQVTYDVEMTAKGRTRTFSLNSAGALIAMEIFLEETPDAVRTSIQKEAGKLGEIQRRTEDGETTFDVDITRNGKPMSFVFDSEGALISSEEPVKPVELPEALQKKLKQQLTEARCVAIKKVTEEAVVTFELELLKSGRHESLRFTPDGKAVPAGE